MILSIYLHTSVSLMHIKEEVREDASRAAGSILLSTSDICKYHMHGPSNVVCNACMITDFASGQRADDYRDRKLPS
jgi:hypothetical protein